GREFPKLLAGLQVQDVKMFVAAADVNPAIADDRGGIDIAAGFEGPFLLAICRVDGVNVSVVSADDGDVVRDGGSGLHEGVAFDLVVGPEGLLAVGADGDDPAAVGADDQAISEACR